MTRKEGYHGHTRGAHSVTQQASNKHVRGKIPAKSISVRAECVTHSRSHGSFLKRVKGRTGERGKPEKGTQVQLTTGQPAPPEKPQKGA